MSDVDILLEMSEGRGRYVVRQGGEEAELTFSVTSPTLRIADHTGVPDTMRNSSVGRALVRRMVEDARREGFKIVPLCPFVNAERRKHPEWADAFNI